MSFKAHLLIVSVIIVVVYLAWGVTRSKPKTPAAQVTAESNFAIAINHASWGLNCPVTVEDDNMLDKAYVMKAPDSRQRPVKDNVLDIISAMCNGKLSCSVSLLDEQFKNIAPENCGEKKLEIEYRCFAFDRPWRKEATSGVLTINCEEHKPQ